MLRKEEVRAFYDATAEGWAKDWYGNESMLPMLRRFVAALPPSARVLDLGCGAGYESMRLKRLGVDVVGIDISERSLAIARERNPDIAFHCMDLAQMNDSLGMFDGIVAIASLVHIPREELGLAFRSVRGRLKPGGTLLAVFREGVGYDERRSRTVIDGAPFDRHFYRHDPGTLVAAAASEELVYIEEWDMEDEKSKSGGWLAYVFTAR